MLNVYTKLPVRFLNFERVMGIAGIWRYLIFKLTVVCYPILNS